MNRNVLAALTAAAVLVGFGIAAGAGAEGAPLSVLSALSCADGAQVILTGVVIDKVVTDPPYLVVREPWSSEIRLIVLLDAPAEVQRWQTVDVTGVMSTLPSDERALSSSSISVYKDTSGRTALIPLPVFPGDESFVPDEAPLQPLARGDQETLDSELEPSTGETPEDGVEWPCPTEEQLSIAGAKCKADDVEVNLVDKVVSRAYSQEGAFYIEESDRSSGIKVEDTAVSVEPGNVVTVLGTMDTDAAGERFIDSSETLVGSSTAAPAPVVIPTREIGGASWRYNPTTHEGQMGTGGFSWGVNNIGLFVRVAGRVILTDGTDYYIDDGSAASSATGAPAPVRVTGFGDYIPLIGDFVIAEGVCGLTTTLAQKYEDAPTPARVIRTTAADTALATANLIGGTGGALAMPEGVPFRLEDGPVVTCDSSPSHSLAIGSQRVFYIQDATQGGAGVQVRYSGPTAVTVGQPLALVGTLATDTDTEEPYIVATGVRVEAAGRSVPPAPTALTAGGIGDSSTMGGFITSGATDPGAVSGEVNSVDTSTPPQFFYLKDSPTGTAYRVSWEWGSTDGNPIVPPCENGSAGCDGQKLVVYGIRSAKATGTGTEPVIRVRTQADIKRLVGRYVAIGDSITHSGPNEGIDGSTYSDWAGKDWGMNASSQAMDYAHLIHRYLNNASASSTLADSTKLGAFGGTLHRLGLPYGSSTYLQTYMDEQPELVTLQIGENETAALEGKARAAPKNWPQNPAGSHFERFEAYTYPAYVPPEGGTIYECIVPYTESNSGNTPAADSTHWAARGSATLYTQGEEAEWKADYQNTYRDTLEAILAGEPRPLVFCYGVWNANQESFYDLTEKAGAEEALMKDVCEELGVPFESVEPYATAQEITGTGVQRAVNWHPGDEAMQGYAALFKSAMAGRIYGAGAPEAFCLDETTILLEWNSSLGRVDVERRETWPDNESAFTVKSGSGGVAPASPDERTSWPDSTATAGHRYVYRVRPWSTGIATGAYETETYKELSDNNSDLTVAALGPAPDNSGITVVYAAQGEAIYASLDAGDNWTRISNAFPLPAGITWPVTALFADAHGHVYTSISSGSGTTGAAGDGKIYRSTISPYNPDNHTLRQVDFEPVRLVTAGSPPPDNVDLILPDALRTYPGSTSQWYHSWGFDQDTSGKLMTGESSQESANNAHVFSSDNDSAVTETNPYALPLFSQSSSIDSLLAGTSYRHMHCVLFDPTHGTSGTWFVTYGDGIKRMGYSQDGGQTFQELPRWRYGPYPSPAEDPNGASRYGGYIGLTLGQSTVIAGTDNYPYGYVHGTQVDRRFDGNSIVRSEDPFANNGGNYSADIVLAFNPDEDAKAYGLKASDDGEVWAALRDDYPPSNLLNDSTTNHHRDSSVWLSLNDGKTWRKLAIGRHALAHSNPLSLPTPMGFGSIASAVQARICGSYVYVSGSNRRLLRFRRFIQEEE